MLLALLDWQQPGVACTCVPSYAAACCAKHRAFSSKQSSMHGNAVQVRTQLRQCQRYTWLVPGAGLPTTLTELRLLRTPEAEESLSGGQLMMHQLGNSCNMPHRHGSVKHTALHNEPASQSKLAGSCYLIVEVVQKVLQRFTSAAHKRVLALECVICEPCVLHELRSRDWAQLHRVVMADVFQCMTLSLHHSALLSRQARRCTRTC
jgi:hypothetical protein